MIEIALSNIQLVSVHHVGNPNNQEDLLISEAPLEHLDDKLHPLLRTYFLSNFTTPEFYKFTFSNEDFTLNPIYKFVTDIFNDKESFHENSINLAKHLYDNTQHPNIKRGDLYIAYINNIAVDGVASEAVGIFKSENKEPFLKLKTYANQFDLAADEGINIKKLDKGCLIFNLEAENGYKLLLVDNAKTDAQFWKDDFLNVTPVADEFHHTQNFMNLTQKYAAEQIKHDFNVSKAEQIDLLNRSVDFFKSKEQFSQAEFETEVLGTPDRIESFRNFGKDFMDNNELNPADNFQISVQAVKQQARIFKSILKLDKNFHVYIHGSSELIEKGFDETIGKHYYKLYFDNES